MSGEPEATGDAVAQDAARVCASFGARLTPGLRFCASCGNWIGADDPVVEAPVLVEEPHALVDEAPDAVDDPATGAEPVEEHPVREVPALAVHEPSLGELSLNDVHSLTSS